MRWALFFAILSSAIALVAYVFVSPAPSTEEQVVVEPVPLFTLPSSPQDASYLFDEADIPLVNGEFADERVNVAVVGDPLYGDVSGNGESDAVVLLQRIEERGAPSYYVALAIFEEGGYLGMNAVPLGLQNPPQSMSLFDELLRVVHLDEGENEVVRYFSLVGIRFSEIVVSEGELVRGVYTRLGSTFSFTPCEGTESYTFTRDSASLAALEAMYRESTRAIQETDEGVYVVLSGEFIESAEGEETGDAFRVASVLRVPVRGACPSITLPQNEEAVIENEVVLFETEQQENHTSPQ